MVWFVLLLVGPSLLMPPGMCICRFAPLASNYATASGNTISDRPASHDAAPSGCPKSCCKKSHGTPAPIEPGEGRPAPENDRDQTPPSGPGCPACLTAGTTKFVEAVGVYPDAAGEHTGPPVLFAVVPVAPRWAPFDEDHPSSPPRFISFCSFLI